MKVILDDTLDKKDGFKEYLLSQVGITSVNFTIKNFTTELDISFDNDMDPIIILKFVELFQKYMCSFLLEFDKENVGNYNIYKYVEDDLCCEYCYKELVRYLFKNKNINSVKSNYDLNVFTTKVELFIEYNSDYSEQSLIEYIDNRYN